MVSPELVHALTAARRRMTQGDWQQLAAKLAAMNASPDSASIRNATGGLLSQDAAWVLSEAFRKSSSANWSEIGVAMTTVDCLAGDNTPLTEIIWTGPANGRFPVRRIDQVLYDLISSAKKRIVLVTFAAHRVHHLCEHLANALRSSRRDRILTRTPAHRLERFGTVWNPTAVRCHYGHPPA
jgi:cardiolipin synthase